MRLFGNLKIAKKLLILVVPLFLALILSNGYLAIEMVRVDHLLNNVLYEESYVSTAYILNADRDFYQAAIAEQRLIEQKGLSSESRAQLEQDYADNVSQVEERIALALENISHNKALYSTYAHEESGLTMEEMGQAFFTYFETWKTLSGSLSGTTDVVETTAAFESARGYIDSMTQVLEAYAEEQSYVVSNNIIQNVVIIASASAGFIILLALLAILLIRLIRRSVMHASELSLAIARGETDFPVDQKLLNKDEVGRLTSVLDGEVRQAFKDASAARTLSEQRMAEQEQAQALTAKRSEYQDEQVARLQESLQKLAKGNLSCDLDIAPGDDETRDLYDLFSRISNDLSGSVQAIGGYIEEVSTVLDSVSVGDLTKTIKRDYVGDFTALRASINTIVVDLRETVSDIYQAAQEVASGTGQVSDGNQNIAQGSTEQASSIEQLTESIRQISDQTRDNAVNAGEANSFSIKAQEAAKHGNEQMASMQEAMTEINEASENIAKIIKVIDDIAFQTNILALNAAVEAARAGTHGKGFAVVAEEVRSLAGRCAEAARETKLMIESSIDKTQSGTEIADETASALASIADLVRSEVELVGRIAEASNEQADNIIEINKGIDQLSRVVTANSATAEEGAAASEELTGQADLLKSKIGRFKLQADS